MLIAKIIGLFVVLHSVGSIAFDISQMSCEQLTESEFQRQMNERLIKFSAISVEVKSYNSEDSEPKCGDGEKVLIRYKDFYKTSCKSEPPASHYEKMSHQIFCVPRVALVTKCLQPVLISLFSAAEAGTCYMNGSSHILNEKECYFSTNKNDSKLSGYDCQSVHEKKTSGAGVESECFLPDFKFCRKKDSSPDSKKTEVQPLIVRTPAQKPTPRPEKPTGNKSKSGSRFDTRR